MKFASNSQAENLLLETLFNASSEETFPDRIFDEQTVIANFQEVAELLIGNYASNFKLPIKKKFDTKFDYFGARHACTCGQLVVRTFLEKFGEKLSFSFIEDFEKHST